MTNAVDNKWPIIATAVGVMLTVYIAVNYFLSTPPAPLATVKAFFGAVERSDYEIAYELFHSDLRDIQAIDEFTVIVKDHSSSFDSGHRQWSTNAEDGSAKVEGQLTTQNGSEASVLFRLVEQDGDWQIMGYRMQGESRIFEVGILP